MVSLPTLLLRAQITPSMSIPNPLPNYDGTYDNFGQGHLFYPNDGEARFNNEERDDAGEYVKFYTMYTYPQKFLLANNNLSLVFTKASTPGTPKVDSLHRVDVEWSGGNSGAALARVDTQNFAKLHYFTEWFSTSGRTDVKGGAAIACQSIYSNIDLVYTSNNAGIVMYFIVYPGGNFNAIRLKLNGAKSHSISGNKLKIDANWESMTFEKPNMYQYTISGSNVISPVNVGNPSWQFVGSNTYKITDTTSYNGSLPLIVQIKQANATTANLPGLDWSTYFGGTQFEFLNRTHTDVGNNLYVGGYSSSSNVTFPQVINVGLNPNNNGDAALVKFNSNGVLQWSTFVGGSSTDEIYDFDFKGGSIYCVGHTASTSMTTVTKAGAMNDATFGGPGWDGLIFELGFIGQNNPPTLDWLTYFGGNGDEELNACKFDSNGDFFVVGASASSNMTVVSGGIGTYTQTFNNAQLTGVPQQLSTDGIIAKFTPSCQVSWFTFYGTDQLNTNAHTHAADYFYGLTISGSDLYVCGKAGGTNLPAGSNSKYNSGNFDGILVHFQTSGVLQTNSAKYTNGNVSNYSVKTLWDNVYVVGEAAGTMSTVSSGLYYYNGSSSGSTDACFSVHDKTGVITIHNTYLGGNADDAAYDIQFTTNNLFYITGGTSSSNFPTNNALSAMYNSTGNPDPNTGIWTKNNFVSAFQPGNTSLIWSTYLGSDDFHESLAFPTGLDQQQPRAISTIALDGLNRLYLLGYTNSNTTFPKDDGGGVPFYVANKNGFMANDATITRFEVVATNAIVGFADFKNTQFVFGLCPNPTAKNISVLNSELVNANLRYAIYELSGKKVMEGTLNAEDAKDINVSPLSRGVYIINISNGNKTFSNKFVKVDN